MERELHQVIRQKVVDALSLSVPPHTRRDVHLPGIKGKAMAVIGMRRSGKTTFLWQCLADRLKAGTPRDTLPPRSPLPGPLRWQSAIAWLLGDALPRKAS